MELPILYAMTYPDRVEDPHLRTFDPVRASPLEFQDVDRDTFPLFGLGERAGREGGTSPAVFNAANEIAVGAFLEERIRFPEMGEVVARVLDRMRRERVESVEQVLETDERARAVARETVRALER
jgi:1-deoxy-D-xylulose-5-phosphate reductoisomerase